MARQPDGDERVLLPACTATRGERVFVRELARYLEHPTQRLMKFAERKGLLHWLATGTGQHALPYVTPYGAMRLIAHARTEQGAVYCAGKDFHAIRHAVMMERRGRLARKRAQVETERAALSVRSGAILAFSGAGAEDEAPEAQTETAE
jgi:hypothetical protein